MWINITSHNIRPLLLSWSHTYIQLNHKWECWCKKLKWGHETIWLLQYSYSVYGTGIQIDCKITIRLALLSKWRQPLYLPWAVSERSKSRSRRQLASFAITTQNHAVPTLFATTNSITKCYLGHNTCVYVSKTPVRINVHTSTHKAELPIKSNQPFFAQFYHAYNAERLNVFAFYVTVGQ